MIKMKLITLAVLSTILLASCGSVNHDTPSSTENNNTDHSESYRYSLFVGSDSIDKTTQLMDRLIERLEETISKIEQIDSCTISINDETTTMEIALTTNANGTLTPEQITAIETLALASLEKTSTLDVAITVLNQPN